MTGGTQAWLLQNATRKHLEHRLHTLPLYTYTLIPHANHDDAEQVKHYTHKDRRKKRFSLYYLAIKTSVFFYMSQLNLLFLQLCDHSDESQCVYILSRKTPAALQDQQSYNFNFHICVCKCFALFRG